ncbi:MAG: ribonuclease R [Flavobacteriales bacterium]|nr:ribonuclease R [Flavobacteriales bacterium]
MFQDPILETMRKSPDRALNYKQIAKRIGVIDKQEKSELARTLNKMKGEGLLREIERGKYRLKHTPAPKLVGKVDMTASGAAYVTVDGFERDVYIPPSKVRQALPGDTVKIRAHANNRGSRVEGEIMEVLERAKETFVGTLSINTTSKVAFMVPDNQKMPIDFFIPLGEMLRAKDGDKVIVKMTEWPSRAKNPIGHVITVLGRPGEMETEMHSILAEFDFPLSFPANVERAAENIDEEISKEEIAKRRDFRKITTFTIDPDDAKDFDDALSIQKLKNGNWEIGVHIADVSHYVRPDTTLDDEAIKRATSVYLVDRVIPMLPEKLSNKVCSLRPKEEKLVFSAVFEMDEKANVVKEWFGRCVINSDQRFTYDDAQKIIEGGESPLKSEVLTMHGLAQQLRAKRFENGAIAFEKEEVKFRLDDKGNPIEVYLKEYKDSNKLIEEFMLLANRQVAAFIGKPKKGQPKTFVYRIHDNPVQERLEMLVTIAGQLDYKVELGPRRIVTASLNKLLADIKGKGEENMLSTMAIRCMAKAEYSTDNIGHFGLGFDYYTHFTSPIRRYPDVMVHRLLQRYLDGGNSAYKKDYDDLCLHSSEMEKQATYAERASTKYMQAKYLQKHIGEEFEGLISGVTEWGIFVEIKENKCEGMIRLKDLPDDFYDYDEDSMSVIGSTTGNSYTLGDAVMVKVRDVSLEKRQIDLLVTGWPE